MNGRETLEQDTRFLLDINYMSAVHCCREATAILKTQHPGVIVHISSQSSIATHQQGSLAAYFAAKAGFTHYTRYLAAELGPYGIRANCLAPGIMMTSCVAAQAALRHIGTNEEADRILLRRLGRVEDCAGVLEFLRQPPFRTIPARRRRQWRLRFSVGASASASSGRAAKRELRLQHGQASRVVLPARKPRLYAHPCRHLRKYAS